MSFTRNPSFEPELHRDIAARTKRAIGKVHQQAVSLLQSPGSGQQYSAYSHPSSAPGDPPVSQSGELEASLAVSGPHDNGSEIEAAVGTPLIKGFFLEAGTANRAPRPFLRPALEMSRGAIMDEFGGGDAG